LEQQPRAEGQRPLVAHLDGQGTAHLVDGHLHDPLAMTSGVVQQDIQDLGCNASGHGDGCENRVHADAESSALAGERPMPAAVDVAEEVTDGSKRRST
jgi:hypothetical protein